MQRGSLSQAHDVLRVGVVAEEMCVVRSKVAGFAAHASARATFEKTLGMGGADFS